MYTLDLIDFSKINKKQNIIIESPSGLLEGVAYNIKDTNNANIALILPPDPSHKGTMNNKIVNLMFNLFEKNGFSTLKINYRGVGSSKGLIKNTKEEKINDALYALDWLIKKCETSGVKSPKIFIAGFSLGGWIALQCAMRRPEIYNFITINANLNPYDFNMLTPCPNGLILQANNDKLTNIEISKKFSSQLINQKGCYVDFREFDDDHYISSNQIFVKETLQKYIKEMLIRDKLKNNS